MLQSIFPDVPFSSVSRVITVGYGDPGSGLGVRRSGCSFRALCLESCHA